VKRAIVSATLLVLVSSLYAQTPPKTTTADSTQVFWEKFRTAIVKGDKETVVALSAYPISMPYGIKDIRNRAQLLKNYRTIFFYEGNAAKCFPKAKPMVDPQNPKEFTIACSITGGIDEPLQYTFTRGRNGWRFTGFDNVNE
jgi:hypothetical protein